MFEKVNVNKIWLIFGLAKSNFQKCMSTHYNTVISFQKTVNLCVLYKSPFFENKFNYSC